MIIKEWDNLIVTDNVLTNLPISMLSSIQTDIDGLSYRDLLLISRPSDLDATTDAEYMSYKVSLGALSSWIQSALGISAIKSDIGEISGYTDLLMPFHDMLVKIKTACPSAVVDIYNEVGKFNPYVISAIYTHEGTIISDLGGYRFADSMSNIFDWKKFSKISALNGYFDNIRATGATFTSVTADSGIFKNLSATVKLSAANEYVTNSHITGLTANNANITGLAANNANITGLAANNANITNLSVGGKPYQHLNVMSQSAYNSAVKQPNYFYFTY